MHPGTAAGRVRAALEADLMQVSRERGRHLDETELAQRFGVSRTPVREALKALAAQGLVEIRPHAGAFVADPAPRKLIEMFEAMAALEAACALHAARRSSAAQREAIAIANRDCATEAVAGDPDAFYSANLRFHDAVCAAAGNAFLAEQTLALRRRLEPWRRSVTGRGGTMRQSVVEHDAILAAIGEGDAEEAGRRASRHLDALGQDALLLIGSLRLAAE